MWRVRTEDDSGPGRQVRFERLARGIEDGVWSETDQARGPNDADWRLIGEHPELEEHLPPAPPFKAGERDEAEMDMTPMIDVTFQLLIFFMIAATYVVQKTLELSAAQAEEAPAAVTLSQLAQDNIIVKVARDRSVSVDGVPAAIDGLTDALRQAARRRKRATAELVLDVDDEVDHETVVKAIDAAAGAEIEKVHFVSRGRSTPGPRSPGKSTAPGEEPPLDLPGGLSPTK
ncbi:MAG TPA: biopolymer transporter ExbD [Pirellulales bacterium]|nr:biopolymer transporter ExbD [Pirellulales bacterium]